MKITERIHNIETGEIEEIERELSVEEQQAIAKFQAEAEAALELEKQREATRQAVLDKLGLTAEEMAAFLSK